REALARDLLYCGSQMATAGDLQAVYEVTTALGHEFCDGPCALLERADDGEWHPLCATPTETSVTLDADTVREFDEALRATGDSPSVRFMSTALCASLTVQVGSALVLYARPLQSRRADDAVHARLEGLVELARASIAHKQLEDAALKSELATESERLRTVLLNSISHELRTPLAAIIGSATSLIDGAELLSTVDRQDLLLTIREGARRMNRLVTNLLSMVRLESGMMTLRRRWCDVSDIIGVALAQVSETFGHRDVQIDLPSELPTIAVDDILIEQALVNVLSNAAKYSPAGSTVRIRVAADDEFVTVRVDDEGIGIRPDEAQRIFDKFYRSPAVAHIPGTGLGLAISRGVMDAHGGRICSEQRQGGGTSIVLTIPIRGADDRPLPAPQVGGRGEDAR
ncbi:MAG: ATP-binding protein, partial [Firmicutes bacterium]|nr:ATP-binding protein [Bacillota bacterium]